MPTWTKWQLGVATHLGELHGSDAARRAEEARCLEGRDVRFPDLVADWAGARTAAERLETSAPKTRGHASSTTKRHREMVEAGHGCDSVGRSS